MKPVRDRLEIQLVILLKVDLGFKQVLQTIDGFIIVILLWKIVDDNKFDANYLTIDDLNNIIRNVVVICL